MTINSKVKRILSFLLVFAMVLQYFPMAAFAANEDNLCEHHPEHTAECGYVEGTSDCSFHCDVCLSQEPAEAPSEEPSEAPAEEPSEAPQCYCAERCTADSINEYCDVCAVDHTGCTGGDTATVYASSGICGDNLIWEYDDNGTLTISGTGEMYSYDTSEDFPWYPYMDQIISVVIAAGVTNVGSYAFAECMNLTEITIPYTVTAIGTGAFSGCHSLTEITIPECVSWIGHYAFSSCENLTKVTFLGDAPSFGVSVFSGTNATGYYPKPLDNPTWTWEVLQSCEDITWKPWCVNDHVIQPLSHLCSDCGEIVGTCREGFIQPYDAPIYYQDSDLVAFKLSVYVQEIGVDALIDKVAICAERVQRNAANGGFVSRIYESEDFRNFLLETIGDWWLAENESYLETIYTNAVLLYAAKLLEENRVDLSVLTSENGAATIESNISNDPAVALAQMAMAYGVYIAYAPDDTDTSPSDILRDMDCPEYREFAGHEDGQAALDAMRRVLSVVYRSTSNWNVMDDLLLYGFASEEVKNALTLTLDNYCHTCDVCGDVSECIWKSATCTEPQICLLCDRTNGKALGHTPIAQDCESGPICAVCGADLTNEPGYTPGHTPGPEADCENDQTCTVCGAVLAEKLGHNYGADNVCTLCGAINCLASGTCGDNLTWVLDENGTLTISGTGAMYSYPLSTPSPWNTYRDQITTIVIAEGATTIGHCAFYECGNLKEITIPASITAIGINAFTRCTSLTEITIPEGVRTIDTATFSYCTSLTDITIPESVTTIGYCAFEGCTSLMEITIPDGVYKIDDYAFVKCTGLKEITIPASVKSIYVGAFKACSGLTKVTFLGNAPAFEEDVFSGVTATAYYPANNTTWTKNAMQDYGGTITWEAYCANHDGIKAHACDICGEVFSVCGEKSVKYYDTTISYQESDVAAIKPTAYVQAIGVDALMDKVAMCVAYAQSNAAGGGFVSNIYESEDFRNFLMELLGDHWLMEHEADLETIYANAVTLYVAKLLEEDKVDLSVLTSENGAATIQSNISNDPAVALAQMALAYGIYVAYAPDDTDANPTQILRDMDSHEYREYAGREEGQGALNAMRRVLSIAYDCISNCNALEHLLLDGFADNELKNAMITALKNFSHTCEVCGAESECIWKSATCTAPRTCLLCGATEGNTPSHTPGAEADCENAQTCTVCGAVLNAATGHSYDAVVTAPTCTEAGYTTYTCACGDSYKADEVAAPGHTVEVVPGYAATCTSVGKTDGKKCSVCNRTLVAQTNIPISDHVYDDGVCVSCGHSVIGSYWVAPKFPEGDYTMLVLPDTQDMASYWLDDYKKQMQWIVDNKDTLNIQAVMHMGDMVDLDQAADWQNSKQATDILDAAGIPWMPMMGNHDGSANFNTYYTYADYSGRSWFRGSYDSKTLEHTYWEVTVGGRDYLILSLGWPYPNNTSELSKVSLAGNVLTWAKGIVEANPDKNIIVTAHMIMNSDGTLMSWTDQNIVDAMGNLTSYAAAAKIPDGDAIWDALKGYENVTLMLSGHIHSQDIIYRSDKNTMGRDVYSMLIDRQNDDTTQHLGMIAILTFDAESDNVSVSYYSTRYDAFYQSSSFDITVPHLHEHNYESVVTAPTCAAQGYTTYTCSICGGSYISDQTEPLDHNYGADGFCTMCDNIGGTCGTSLTWVLDREGRLIISGTGKMNTYSSTSTAPWYNNRASITSVVVESGVTSIGNYAFYNCSNLTKITFLGDAPTFTTLLAKTFSSVTATAYYPGENTTWTTSNKKSYGGTITWVAICSGEHTPGAAAGCANDQVCTVCGIILARKLGHTSGAAADCMNDQICTVCGAVLNTATGHNYNAVVTEPTCTEGGYTTYTCACGDEYVDAYTAVTDHPYGEWVETKAPTCTTEGEQVRTCTACGATDSEAIAALDHTEGDVIVENEVAAECDNAGSYDNVIYCTACGVELSRETITVDAPGHSYDEGVVTVAPTCSTKGVKTFTCTCGDSYTEVIPATGEHTYNYSCDSVCNVCGETTRNPSHKGKYKCSKDCMYCGETVFPNAEHVEEPYVSVGAQHQATCEEAGYAKCRKYCDYCGTTMRSWTQTFEPLGHRYVATVTEPTCTEGGYTTYKCDRSGCRNSYVDDYTDPTGHSYGEWYTVNGPSCNAAGDQRRDCVNCDAYELDEIAMEAHTERILPAVPATCTATGLTEGKDCSVCGAILVEQKETPVVDHTPGKAADCVNAQTCTVCGIELAAAKGHREDYGKMENNVEATCETGGSYDIVIGCKDCYKELRRTQVVTDPLGHDYQSTVIAPTCTEQGYTTYTCANCSHSYTGDEVDPLGHTPGAEADCENAQTCTVCGAVLNAATGHNYNAVVTEPTCTEGGYTTYTCACGDTYVSDEVDALGHSYDNNYDADCNVCGAIREVDLHVSSAEHACQAGTCIHCGIEMPATADHIYTNGFDPDCDTCGAIRAAASIGTVEYETLEEAFAAAKEGDTIVMLKSHKIAKGATEVWDLTGKTLENSRCISVEGSLEILGGTYNFNSGSSNLTVSENGSITIQDGTFHVSTRWGIWADHGKITFNGGTFYVTGDGWIGTQARFSGSNALAQFLIQGGTFYIRDNAQYADYGRSTISGGTFYLENQNRGSILAGYSDYADSLTISGGTFYISAPIAFETDSFKVQFYIKNGTFISTVGEITMIKKGTNSTVGVYGGSYSQDMSSYLSSSYCCNLVGEYYVVGSHRYTVENPAEGYLKTAATCENAAEYYLSCACGKAGTTTFFYGDPLGHTDDSDHICDRCGAQMGGCADEDSDGYCDVCGKWIDISGTCGTDLTWTLDEAGKLTISGTGRMTDYAMPSCSFLSAEKYGNKA